MGLHYAITCNEFVSRIRPEEVEPATSGSFLGSWRVRDQMAACQNWPKTELPNDYFEPFQLDAPAVLVSGEADATGSRGRWGKEVASFMPNAVHVIVPGGGHTPDNDLHAPHPARLVPVRHYEGPGHQLHGQAAAAGFQAAHPANKM